MRFGPLGHQGGERRLNVAITRAKHNIKLVGSIMPYDIDLSKTKSEGIRMLKDYIEFAIKAVRYCIRIRVSMYYMKQMSSVMVLQDSLQVKGITLNNMLETQTTKLI